MRQRGDVVGRLTEVHATRGDLLYLRMLLLRRKGVLSFTELRTVDGIVYNTFKDACAALGLLNNDNQWHDALSENSDSSMPFQLRAMFVNILVYCSVSNPYGLWEAHWKALSDDVLYNKRKVTENIHLSLTEYEIQNYAFAGIVNFVFGCPFKKIIIIHIIFFEKKDNSILKSNNACCQKKK